MLPKEVLAKTQVEKAQHSPVEQFDIFRLFWWDFSGYAFYSFSIFVLIMLWFVASIYVAKVVPVLWKFECQYLCAYTFCWAAEVGWVM